MSGSNNIRWREKDERELKRLIKNAKSKVYRQRKKLVDSGRRYEAAQLPQIPSYTQARQDITTRKEFNSFIDETTNFIKTGNKFKLDKVTEKSLVSTVEKFNAKVERLKIKPKRRSHNEHQTYMAALPDQLDIKEVIKNASNKEALKRDIQTYKDFLRRGAEEMIDVPDTKYNIKLTKWQKSLMEEAEAEINANRERERQEWLETEVKYGGKEAGYTQGQARMDKGDYDRFYPMQAFTEAIEYRDIHSKLRTMMRERQPGYWEARTQLAKINYVEKLKQIIGNHPIGKKIINHLNTLPLNDFKRTLLGDDDLFALVYELERHPDNFDTVLEEIFNQWFPEQDMYEELDKYLDRNE